MKRKSEFSDTPFNKAVKERCQEFFCESKEGSVVIFDSFLMDDERFKANKYSTFDGYIVYQVNNIGNETFRRDGNYYERFAFLEIKERRKDFKELLIEFEKIEPWVEHREKWKEFFYVSSQSSGLYLLDVRELFNTLGLKDDLGNLFEVFYQDGKRLFNGEIKDIQYGDLGEQIFTCFDFDRKRPREGSIKRLASDDGKSGMFVDKEYWYYFNWRIR
jgi:hypothetical protein